MSQITPKTIIMFAAACLVLGGSQYVSVPSAFADSMTIQMQDNTTSFGLSTYSSRQIQAEYVSSTSSLVGKPIDTIVINLQKSGSPSGPIQVGVFNPDKSVKQLFGTIDASSVSGSYTQYTFSLSVPQNYVIQSGDSIGIKFTGGDSSNVIGIMTDQINSFDGTNSYLTYYTTAWKSFTGSDLSMILKNHVYSNSLEVTASPFGGTYSSSQSVTLATSILSTIYYTTDGSTPTISSASGASPLSGITISSSTTLKYFAKDGSGNIGSMGSAAYTIISIVTPMNDNTNSYGLSTYSGRQIQAEYVSSTSSLVGKLIDTIVVKLQRYGSPSGPIQVGVFNPDKSVKQLFGTIDASSVSGSYKQYSFSLPTQQNYQIQSGDSIGIKFTGGDASTNMIGIMTDQINSFDGANSYLTYYDTKWQSFTGSDLSMILKYHVYASGPVAIASPSGGTYFIPQSVTLATSIPSTIYYTTDGSTPTISSSSGASPLSGIIINTNSTLQFFAKDSSGNPSPVVAQKYNINLDLSTSIAQLYPTATNGKQWYANWYTMPHTLNSGDFDPYDPYFQARGDGIVIVNGDGTATLSGDQPRMRAYDSTLQKLWNNVEITIYAKRVSELSQYDSAGITAVARSGSHDDVTYPDICTDTSGYPDSAYGGRITYDGRADYVKEVLYHRGDAISDNYTSTSPKTIAAFSNFATPISPSTGLHTMPKNTWIGYKFIVRNINNGAAVKMETWMDLTGELNGGTWNKINSYIDNGVWPATQFYGYSTWPCSTVPKNYVITHAMPFIFVRNDGVQEADYKNFSIREIDPLP